MASESWTNLAGGAWETAGNWSALTVPGTATAVTIGVATTGPVTINGTDFASSLNISNTGATLALQTGSLTLAGNLTNAGTISLAGTTSLTGATGVTNTGVVNVGSTSSLTVTGTSGSFTQDAGTTSIAGTLSAANVTVFGGTFSDTGTFTNTGTITASNAKVTFATITNVGTSGTLTGGTYRVLAGGTLDLQNGTVGITALDAALNLNGANAVANTGTASIASQLTAIGTGGVLNVLGGNFFNGGTNTLALSGSGSLDVFTGSSLTESSIVVNGTGTATDGGAITSNVTLNSGTLALAAGSTLTGNVTVGSTGTLSIASGSTLTGTVTGGTGTLDLVSGTGAGTVTLTGTAGAFSGFSNVAVKSGTWTVDSSSTTLPATMTGDGATSTLAFTGTATGAINLGGVKNFNTIDLASGTNTVTGVIGTTLSGGTVTINGGSGPDSITVDTSTSTGAGKTLIFNAGTASTGDSFAGGNENDIVKGTASALTGDTLSGGGGTNTITLTGRGTGTGAVDLSNASQFPTINLSGGDQVTLSSKGFVTGTTVNNVTVNGSTTAVTDSVTSTSTGTAAAKGILTYLMGASTTLNKFVGGAEIDVVKGAAAAVTGDTLTGGSDAAKNTLTMTSGGTLNLSNVKNFDSITLAGPVANSVTISSTTLTGSSGTTPVTIHDANSGTTLTSTGTAGQALLFSAGTGKDSFTGGAEADKVTVSAAAVSSDVLNGGTAGDANTLTLTSAGTAINLGSVSNFATINLAAGTNKVTDSSFGNAFQGGALTINGGGGTNTITVSGATGTAGTGGTLTYNYVGGVQTTFTSSGSEIDIFNISAANASADALTASSSGSNILNVKTAGTFNLTKDSNFGTIDLTAGTNVVTALGSELNGTTVTTTGTATNSNTLDIVSSGTATAIGTVDLSNAGKISTINLEKPGGAVITVGATTLAGNGNDKLTINDIAGSANANSITVNTGTTGAVGTLTYVAAIAGDIFQGGTGGIGENDIVKVNPNQLGAGLDKLTGSTNGSNTLILTAAGTLDLPVAQVKNFGIIDLAAGSNRVTIGSTAFVNGTLSITDGTSGNNVVQGGSGSGGDTLTYNAGNGLDYFQGGSENDLVKVAAAKVGGDILIGGTGTLAVSNVLDLTSAGAFSLGGVQNFDQINLHAGNNTVTVTPGTLFGTLGGEIVTIVGGNTVTGSTTINGDGAAGESLIYLADHGATTFNAGAENDTFTFTDASAGLATIAGFGLSNDVLAFSKSSFTNNTVVPTLTTGSTDIPTGTNEFYYNKSDGKLFYNSSSGGSSFHEIGVLSNHALITTSNLTFV